MIGALLAGAALAGDVSGGGRVESHLRMATTGCTPQYLGDCAWLDFRDTAVLGGWAKARPSDAVVAYGAVDFRLHQGVSAELLDDTAQPEQVINGSIRVQDAWVELRGVGVEAADLRIGVQTIRWGVGAGLHVVDNVNPWNLENPVALDARLPVPAAQLLLHRGAVAFEVVAVPLSFPAALPVDGVELVPTDTDLLDSDAFDGTEVGGLEARVEPPERTLADGAAGARLAWAAPFGDLAASFYHGVDSLPQASGEMILTGFQTDQNRVDIAVPLIYPRVDVVGLEARGELFADIAGWVEVAGVLPSRARVTASETQLESLATLGTIDEVPDPLPELVTQDGEPYVKAVAGLSRGFGRVFLVGQWLYGYPTERQRADLRHYASLSARITVADPVVFSLRTLSDFGGWLVAGELAILHGDAAELTLGGAWVEGPSDSALGAFRGVSHVGAGAKLVF